MTLTALSEFALAVGAGDFVDLSSEASGLGSWQVVDTRQTRPIPSLPGVLVVQRLPNGTATATFTVDDNAATHPLLFMRLGAAAKVRVRPFGAGSGKAQIVLTGLLRSITLSNPPGDVRQFAVTLEASGVDDTAQT